MGSAVFHFSESTGPAGRLARKLGVRPMPIMVRHFPDGESLVRVEQPPSTVFLYCSLNNPNVKLVELLLAVSAIRDNGAIRVMLIAPYLGYMRQDIAFDPGEAVSQKVIGQLLAEHFDAIISIDPHLHRVHDLSEVFPETETSSISASPVLAKVLGDLDNPILVGPDSESRPWVEAIARPFQFDVLVGEKCRRGDRDVAITIAGVEHAAGRHAILVDDLISSGSTLIAAARLLLEAGATGIEALASHCLASSADLERMHAAGIERVSSTESVEGPTTRIPIAGLLADEIRRLGWHSAYEK